MASTLSRLVIELAANTAKLQSDMGRAVQIAQRAAGQIKGALGVLGAGISVAGLVAFTKSTIDAADRLNDLRTRTGLTGQQLLVLEGAALRSGLGIEAISEFSTKYSKNITDAARGTGKMAEGLAAMGIKARAAGGGFRTIDDFLETVGNQFREFEDGANKSALAVAILGRGGDRLIPLAESVAETRERFKRLGITISEDLITASDKFNDTMEDIRAVNQVTSRELVSALLPYMQQLADAFLEGNKQGGAFKDVLNALLIPVKVLASGFVGIYASIAATGEAITGLYLASQQLKSGNLGKAVDELAIASGRASKRLADAGGIIRKFWEDASGTTAAKPTRGGRPDAPGMADLNALKAGADALAKLRETQSKIALDSMKESGQREQQLLDQLHGMGLVAERAYWERRVDIARQATQAELGVLDNLIAEQEKRVQAAAGAGDVKAYYTAVGELQESLAKRNKLEADFAQVVEVSYHQAQQAGAAYRRTVEELDAEIMELTGHEAEAARLRTLIEQESLRTQFKSERDQAATPAARAEAEEALKRLDRIRQLKVAQADFNAAKREQDEVNARLAMQEERIQNQRRTGSATELEAMRLTEVERRKAADQLAVIAGRMSEIAAMAENPALRRQAEEAAVAVDSLRASMNLLGDKINAVFEDALGDAFSDFITGTKTASEAFRSFVNSVIREFSRMQAQSLAQMLSGGTGGGGGLGGIISELFGGGLSGLFGDRGISSVNAAFGGMGAEAGMFAGAFEHGGTVPRTGLALVHAGEEIIPAGKTQGGGDVYNIDARGASLEAVQRLERMVMAVNGSIESRAVAAVSEHGMRGR